MLQIKQQAVALRVAVAINEIVEDLFQPAAVRIEAGFDGKIPGFKQLFDALQFGRDAVQVRPAGGIVADPDEQGVAALVEFQLFRPAGGVPGDYRDGTAAGGISSGQEQKNKNQPQPKSNILLPHHHPPDLPRKEFTSIDTIAKIIVTCQWQKYPAGGRQPMMPAATRPPIKPDRWPAVEIP